MVEANVGVEHAGAGVSVTIKPPAGDSTLSDSVNAEWKCVCVYMQQKIPPTSSIPVRHHFPVPDEE